MGGVDILQDMVDTAKSEGGTLKNALGLSSDCAMNMEEKAKQATTNNDDLDKFCKEVRGHNRFLYCKIFSIFSSLHFLLFLVKM